MKSFVFYKLVAYIYIASFVFHPTLSHGLLSMPNNVLPRLITKILYHETVFINQFIPKVYSKSLFQKFIPKVYSKSLFQKFIPKVYSKSLFQKFIPKVYSKSYFLHNSNAGIEFVNQRLLTNTKVHSRSTINSSLRSTTIPMLLIDRIRHQFYHKADFLTASPSSLISKYLIIKRLVLIIFISAISTGSTYSQNPYNYAYLDFPNPGAWYNIGCDPIEFKWFVAGGLYHKDAQIEFYTDFFEFVSLEWEEAPNRGTPNHSVDPPYYDSLRGAFITRIKFEDYYEEDAFGNSLQARGTVKLLAIKEFYGQTTGEILHQAKYSLSSVWLEGQIWLPQIRGNIISGTVSSMINSSKMSTADLACSGSPGYHYHVESDLIVDIDYCFNSRINAQGEFAGTITLAPNVNIIVNEGINLDISKTIIKPCEGTWGSIVLQEGASLRVNKSHILDANLAIHQLGETDVVIIDSDIEDCHSGIHSEGGSTLIIKNSTISNSTTEGRGSLAVDLNNHEFCKIEFSHFENFQSGVKAVNSYINSSNSTFDNFEEGSEGNGHGFELYGEPFHLATIAGNIGVIPGPVTNFQNLNTGIYAEGQRVVAEYNRMSNVDFGVQLLNSAAWQQKVNHNEISAKNIGILLANNSGSRGEVNSNSITIQAGGLNPSATACISINNTGTVWDVNENYLNLGRGAHGITGGSNSVVAIRDNLILLQPYGTTYGIRLYSDFLTRMSCNEVIGDGASGAEQIGVQMALMRTYTANCNQVADVDKAFLFGQTNTGMNRLRGNTLGGVNGIWIETDGSCDQQFNQGNCFDGSEATYNSLRPIEESKFLYNNDSLQGGAACYYPQVVNGPIEWFRFNSSFEFDCSAFQINCNTPDIPIDSAVCQSTAYQSLLADTTEWSFDQEAQQFYGELAIYQSLKKTDCLNRANSLDSLVDAHNSDLWEYFVNLEDSLLSKSSALHHTDSLLNLYQHERNLWYDSLAIVLSDTNGVDSAALQSYYYEISSLNSSINNLYSQRQFAWESVLSSLLSDISTAETSSIHEYRLANVLGIYVESMVQDTLSAFVSSQDSAYLDSIASLCIYSTGYAGALARHMLSVYDPLRTYPDDSLCHPQQALRSNPENALFADAHESLTIHESTVDFQIAPNPASDHIIVTYTASGTASLQIHDMAGVVMLERNILSGDNRIDLQKLQPGIYLVSLRNHEGVVSTQKLIK